jgi:hypothetical protein
MPLGQHDLLSTRDIRGMFYEELKQDFGQSWLADVAAGPFSSDQAQETYPWLGMVPAMEARKGANVFADLLERYITIKNIEYQTGVKVDRMFARRNKTDQLRVRLADLASRAGYLPKSLIRTLIKNGTGSTSGLCYDGQNFFSATHSEGASGTQLNLLTNTQVAPLDIGTPTDPTEAEAALALMGVIGYMMTYKDDQGEAINEEAEQFLVLCPFNLYGAFQAANRNRLLNTGSGSATNPLPGDWTIKVKMAAGIEATAGTASPVFYVFRTDGRSKAFILQEEVPATLEILGPGSEYEKEHGHHAYSTWRSMGAGYGHWHHATHNTLS